MNSTIKIQIYNELNNEIINTIKTDMLNPLTIIDTFGYPIIDNYILSQNDNIISIEISFNENTKIIQQLIFDFGIRIGRLTKQYNLTLPRVSVQ